MRGSFEKIKVYLLFPYFGGTTSCLPCLSATQYAGTGKVRQSAWQNERTEQTNNSYA